MRKDVTALLEKLGRRDFQYREFVDPIADLEPWPLFAALLADPRVVGEPDRAVEARAPTPNASSASSAFLADYADPEEPAPRREQPRGSLHSFLSELSGDPAKGA